VPTNNMLFSGFVMDSRSVWQRWFRSLWGPTLFAVPGAIAQAGNNAASGFVRRAMVTTPGVSAWQSIWAALSVAFVATTLMCWLLQRAYRGTPKAFTWKLPSARVLFWHELRLVIGFTATLLIIASAQEAMAQGNPPVALITVLSSTSAIYLAAYDLKRFHRYDGVVLVVTQVAVTALGFAGILVAGWQSVATVRGFAWPIAASAFSGLLLCLLPLVQNRLVIREEQNPVKVVGYFAVQASGISVVGLICASLASGVLPQVGGALVLSALALAGCYAVSQMLLQLANGFGTPSVVAVLVYLGIPAGYVLDLVLLGKTPTWSQLVGGGLILLSALGIKTLEARLTERRPRA
jgi:drug/metabolite transporter (DMT)-like permease